VVRRGEPRSPSERSLALVDRVAEQIRPDGPALVDWFTRYCREHRARFALDLDLVEAHVAPRARVLEYGAVPLVVTAALAAMEYDVTGVDIDPARFAASIAALGLDVRRCDIETEPVPFASDSVDAVVFNELFEHLRVNPISTLREVHRVLRTGGRLLLSTPNLRSLRGLRNLVLHDRGHAASGGVYEQYEKLETLGHMGHVREYTVREVAEFLARIGFRVDEVVFRGGYGRGVVGLVERAAPSLRPSFTMIASKDASPEERRQAGAEVE
jgi:SAM-dependent methyltransferase